MDHYSPGSGLIPNTEDQITLSGGVYQLLVTDGNGCVDSVQYTIDEPDTIVSNGVVTDISCYDQIDGAINLNLTGGATPTALSPGQAQTLPSQIQVVISPHLLT